MRSATANSNHPCPVFSLPVTCSVMSSYNEILQLLQYLFICADHIKLSLLVVGDVYVRSVTVGSDSLRPCGLYSRLLCLWNSPGKNSAVGCHFLLQEIFLTQGLDLYFLHWQANSLPVSHLGSQVCLLRVCNYP